MTGPFTFAVFYLKGPCSAFKCNIEVDACVCMHPVNQTHRYWAALNALFWLVHYFCNSLTTTCNIFKLTFPHTWHAHELRGPAREYLSSVVFCSWWILHAHAWCSWPIRAEWALKKQCCFHSVCTAVLQQREVEVGQCVFCTSKHCRGFSIDPKWK